MIVMKMNVTMVLLMMMKINSILMVKPNIIMAMITIMVVMKRMTTSEPNRQ